MKGNWETRYRQTEGSKGVNYQYFMSSVDPIKPPKCRKCSLPPLVLSSMMLHFQTHTELVATSTAPLLNFNDL